MVVVSLSGSVVIGLSVAVVISPVMVAVENASVVIAVVMVSVVVDIGPGVELGSILSLSVMLKVRTLICSR